MCARHSCFENPACGKLDICAAVAKEICSYAALFEGRVDRVVLTGGVAHSAYVAREVARMTAFLAPMEVVAGEFEMEALALGALRVLRGEAPKDYAKAAVMRTTL